MSRLLAILFLLGLVTTHAQQLITPTGITQTAGNALGGYAPDNLVNSAGLSSEPTLANYPSVTDAGGANNTWVTATASFPNYFNGSNSPPSFLIPLPLESALTHLVVWGYGGNNNEASNFTLEFSTDGGNTFPSSTTVATSSLVGTASASLAFPSSFDADTVRLTITDNAGGRGFSGAGSGDRVGLGEIRFIGAAAGDPGPVLDLPGSIALTPDGSVQTIEIPVSNSGTSNTLNISSTSVTGTHAAAFTVISAPATLAPLAGDTIQLSLNPTGLSGNISASLSVLSDDVLAPTSTVTLSGFLHDPQIDTTPTLDFGALNPADPQLELELTISNTAGNNPLTISSASVSGTGADRFTVATPPASIAPLSSAAVTLTFDPSGEPGFFDAKLNLSTNDPANPLTVVNLTARTASVDLTASVVISEFMASNDTTLDDGDGDSSDWVELHNTTVTPVDLTGWSLTDNPDRPTKWSFPAGVTLPANGHLVVFASNKGPGYVDAGGAHHTNFRLSTSGDYLALVKPDGITTASRFEPTFPAQFTDVAYGSFTSGGSTAELVTAATPPQVLIPENGDLGTTWNLPGFIPDAAWTTGAAQGVGYDTAADYTPYIDTDVLAGMQGENATAYIRLPFNIDDATAYSSLTLKIRYEDGFIAYLNGTEIATGGNTPANPSWDSSTSNNTRSEAAAVQLEPIDVTQYLNSLQNGTNVLAIHGLNASTGSSDFLIDARLDAVAPGTGPAAFGYLAGATPGSPNTFPASNPGPEILAVTHTPLEPSASQNLTVTATTAPRLAAVSALTLHHRTGFGATTTVTMTDNNDGTYSASIPASGYAAGDMVRYFVTATDTAANSSRAPAFLDTTGKSQSPEYFGTVVTDPSITVAIPVFHWFAPSLNAGHTRSGTRTSVYYQGRFYDNLFVRQRGQATNSSVSQKFDFNKGEPFYIDETLDAVGEININGNGADSSYIRQPLAFETYRIAGNAGCLSGFWHMRGNGRRDRSGRPGIWIEQVDEDFLDRNGYDRDGDLYKFVQRSTLRPVFNDTTTGIEKKTNPETGLATAQVLVGGLNGDTPSTFAIDHLDLSQINNYLAVRCITMDADDIRKNFYMFHDTHGDARWRLFPWDKDFTFGVRGDGGPNLDHPFFGEQEHLKTNANQWNVLLDVLFGDTLTNRLYLRRLRTVIDTVLENSSGNLDARTIAYAAEARQSSSPVLSYLRSRRSYLNNFSHSSDPEERIPASQPSNPDVTITAAEPNPSTTQDHEYIRLTNAENTEIDISGYSLTGGVKITFAPGTVIPRNGHLYVSPDTLAFRARTSSPTGGQRLVVVGPYAGHLSNFGETLELLDPSSTVVSTFQTPVTPSDAQLYLRVSEIMYHPADPHPDAEFIELVNTSETRTLDLDGVSFTSGIDFTFPTATTLAPGARILVVYDTTAFQTVHGNAFDASIAGEFGPGSRLNNDGDRIRLDDASGSTVLGFRYNDAAPWPGGSDGGGHSLVLLDPTLDPDEPTSWRPSTSPGGDPATSDHTPYTPGTDLVGYALGTPDITLTGNTLTFVQIPGADDAVVTPEVSTGLTSWTSGGFDLVSRTPAATTYSLALPQDAPTVLFVRLRVSLR